MGIYSAQDIRAQIVKEDIYANSELPEEVLAKSDKHIEIGQAIRRMTQSTGWKILEFWMLKQIDLYGLLNSTGEEGERLKSEGRVYGKILSQVESWQRLSERLEKLKEKEE